MEITVKKLTVNDLNEFSSLIHIYAEAFEVENFVLPSAHYLQSLLKKEYMFFLTACNENQVIGGLTAYILSSVYEAKTEVYIFDIAVKPEFQQKGIGTKLLSELKVYCKAAGHKNIFVQADFEDTHALNFYRKTGGSEADVRHFNYDLL